MTNVERGPSESQTKERRPDDGSSERTRSLLLHHAQPPFHRVPIDNVTRISGGALYLDFDPVGTSQFEVPLDDGPGEVVHLSKGFPSSIVEVSLPMLGRMSTATCCAKNEELRVGRPLGLLNIAAVLTIR